MACPNVVILLLKILTFVIGGITIGLTAHSFCLPFPDPDFNFTAACSGNTSSNSSLTPPTNTSDCNVIPPLVHVIQDYVVLAFTCIALVVTMISIYFHLFTKISTIVDRVILMLGGFLLLTAGILWSISVYGRSINCSKNDITACLATNVTAQAAVYYGNLSVVTFAYEEKTFNPKFDKENGRLKFIEIVVNAALILLNAILFFLLALLPRRPSSTSPEDSSFKSGGLKNKKSQLETKVTTTEEDGRRHRKTTTKHTRIEDDRWHKNGHHHRSRKRRHSDSDSDESGSSEPSRHHHYKRRRKHHNPKLHLNIKLG